jgi:transcriptional regulator with XRE-family HTH domain
MRAMSFGQYIRELRGQKGLTQRRMASLAGMDFTYLSKIENDRLEHTPSLKTLRDLARVLEVDELELLERANKVPPVLEVIARDKDALRFFRRATETIKDPAGWRDLLTYLEHREGIRRSTNAEGSESASIGRDKSAAEVDEPWQG